MHIQTKQLEAVMRDMINAYNSLPLPKYWGSGKRAAADGSKFEIYENNLMSEYHIRYGGYGGIAYHHVSDTYIALFMHFITCGVWEAVYIQGWAAQEYFGYSAGHASCGYSRTIGSSVWFSILIGYQADATHS